VRYRFLIDDRASIHDFHLSGPGLNRVLTGVDFTGTKDVVLTLKKGVYRYVCDPHSGSCMAASASSDARADPAPSLTLPRAP
jgi:hypothetical protein